MAELATGAVSTLLGVISNEGQRLGRVRGDVQFIQEEMESMSSFLANLSRGNIRDQQHDGGGGDDGDDQIRTWMNQVRILANDCNACLDLYLYRRDPELHRSKAGLHRYLYLWWAPWFVRKMRVQHRAAGQLRELKERAREIGERRLRYGVEVKRPSSSGSGSGLTKEDVHGEEEEEEEDNDDDGGRRLLNQDGGDHRSLELALSMMNMDEEDYLKWRLDDHWIRPVVLQGTAGSKEQVFLPSIVFLVRRTEDASFLVNQAMDVAEHALAHQEGEAAMPLDARGAPASEKSHLGHHGEEDDDSASVHIYKIQMKYPRNVVLVDVPEAVHYDFFLQRRPEDFLYYILHELLHCDPKPQSSHEEDQQQATAPPSPTLKERIGVIYSSKQKVFREIKHEIQERNKLNKKFEDLKTEICQVEEPKEVQKLDKTDVNNKELREKITTKPLHKLFRLLIESTVAATEQDRANKAMGKLVASYNYIIKQTAKKLKEKIEGGANQQAPEYEHILWKVFPKPAAAATANTFVDGQIKEIIHGVKEIIHELRESDSSDKVREGGETAAAQKWQADFKETTRKKMEEIEWKITKQLKIKGIVRRIQDCLEGDKRILVILKTDGNCVSKWEETRNTLRQLGCAPIAGAIIVATETTQRQDVKEEDLCYPQLELIDYSPVARFLDTVLQITRQHVHEGSRRILRNIFYKCEAHEFCMKIFAHTMYTKPKRSRKELHKLYMSLHEQDTQQSLPGAAIAKKMLKFSYKDLPKQYRSCLLYLAIFPRGTEIRRSTLIGRWVAEGLITTKDWRWSSSVDEAENCLDTLIARCLVCPAGNGIGAAGRFKSCKVTEPVYGFITKIAMKQRILDTRLAYDLAHHFSIFSDVRLRNSENVEDFLKSIRKPKSSRFSKLKVLDLEGCGTCLAEKHHYYLRAICSKIVMLKYLSLRGTDVTHLPGEINYLLELEVLDIRRTKIHASETRKVLLLKLKRLLAGHVDPSNPPDGFSSVQIPEKIEKMEGVEVLSNVKPKNEQDLNDIGNLCMLKKLGVVINKGSDLQQLLRTISDILHRCLRSLSITLNIETGTPAGQGILPYSSELPEDKFPKVLESLNIIGSSRTQGYDHKLLTLCAKDANKLAKVTLNGTWLSEAGLKVLAKLPKLSCVRLRHVKYTNNTKLTFIEGEFQNLTSFVIEGPGITEIKFEDGAASNLEKMVCSFTNMKSISGIDNVPRIKKVEFNGETVPKEVEEAMARQTRRPVYIHNPEPEIRTSQQEMPDDDASSSWKKVKCLGWRN